jgi:thiosulfate dehydrogenase (quinone) large subunit
MFVSFLESLRHVGQLYPVALLRIFFGYTYFSDALERATGPYIVQPRLAATLVKNISEANLWPWYHEAIETIVIPNWQFFAYALVYLEFIIGISLILGFLVRPVTLIGLFLSANAMFLLHGDSYALSSLHLLVFFVLFWIGAGRCLGFDYYFYKRHRGLWW